MELVQLTIGHNVGNTPRWSSADVATTCADVLGIDGMTVIPCLGMWCGMPEQSSRVEIVTDDPARIISRIPQLCETLEQDAIMCAYAGHIDFVSPVHA